VIRPGGYIFTIVPHKDRTFDQPRARTTLSELLCRHESGDCPHGDAHHSVWITEDMTELLRYLGMKVVALQDVDDKVGNGFTIVVQKEHAGALPWPPGRETLRAEATRIMTGP
jgi:hypothetical protein